MDELAKAPFEGAYSRGTRTAIRNQVLFDDVGCHSLEWLVGDWLAIQ